MQQSGAAPAPRPAGQSRPASDFMVDVLKKIGFEYAAINPGSTFQGLHESLVNYGGNSTPELLTCLHEEAAAAMAHGYAKASGKPMLVVVHGTVGLLHSSMALFQAWADRVPVVIMVGHHRNPTGVINRPHSAQDMGLLVRSFVKFDDEATNLERFADAAMRAYKIAMTPPMGPVVLTVSAELQESIVTNAPRIPELVMPAPPQGEAAAVRETQREWAVPFQRRRRRLRNQPHTGGVHFAHQRVAQHRVEAAQHPVATQHHGHFRAQRLEYAGQLR